jgi:hypothetical protein
MSRRSARLVLNGLPTARSSSLRKQVRGEHRFQRDASNVGAGEIPRTSGALGRRCRRVLTTRAAHTFPRVG